MTDLTALRDLLAKVEAGILPRLWPLFDAVTSSRLTRAFEGHETSAIALCKSVLPGWLWAVSSQGASIYNPGVEGDAIEFHNDGDPALALLICTIRGLIWEAGQ